MFDLTHYNRIINTTQLPDNITFYRGYGGEQVLFGIESLSGGVRAEFICYLISQVGLNWYRWAVEIAPLKESCEIFEAKLEEAVELFVAKLKDGTATKVDLDGGDLGREIHN